MNIKHSVFSKAGSLMLALLLTIGVSASANAHLAINDDKSTISFVTVKAEHVAEVHTFDRLSGHIGDDGDVEIDIHLSSVNTLIPIRNERMQAMLFETNMFPRATINAQVDLERFESMAAGSTETMTLDFDLALHGQTQSMSAEVRVVRLEEGMVVSTIKPIIVTADKFDLVAGVEKLREVAGLPSISRAVPVSFELVLDYDH
jgi:polyisoprenoid-binding protein YceI